MKVKLFFLVWFSSLQSLGVEMTAPETRQIVSSLTQERYKMLMRYGISPNWGIGNRKVLRN